MTTESEIPPLRVLIANERRDHLDLLAKVVGDLGHEVVAAETNVSDVGPATVREHPNVALVGLGESSQHALDLIEQIVHESNCPVIALLSAEDPVFIREAANRGVFAYIVDTVPEELQSAIDITLLRFSEFHDLEGAFGRRATIEQAKGILMARNSIGSEKAFAILRRQSNRSGEKLVSVATAIVQSHLLLPSTSGER